MGRIVTVRHPDVPLTLCEVEVYSTFEHPENTFPQRPARYSKHLIEFCDVLIHLFQLPSNFLVILLEC